VDLADAQSAVLALSEHLKKANVTQSVTHGNKKSLEKFSNAHQSQLE
jgi:hypothetical protein